MSVPTVLTIPDHAKGILLCVIGVMVLTPDTLLIRKAAEGTSTPTLLFFRYGFHGCSVLSYILATEKSKAWDTIKGIGKLGVLAGVLLGAANIFFTYGVEYTAVANVLVILACNPLFAALFSWALVGEVVKARTAATMCVSLGAIALIFYDQIGADSTDKSGLGNVFAVAAAVLLGLFFAVVHFAKKRLERDINMVPCNIMAGVFVVIVSLLLGARPDSTSVWSPPLHTFGYLALQGLLSMPVSFSLFTVALHYVTAPEVSMFFLVETCLGPLWVWLGGYEAPPPFTLLGGGIVILVLIIHSYLAIKEERSGNRAAVNGVRALSPEEAFATDLSERLSQYSMQLSSRQSERVLPPDARTDHYAMSMIKPKAVEEEEAEV